jgi:hypothetical protein
MALKFRKHLPKMIFDTSMCEAFVDGNYGALYQLCDLRPWEMSPITCHRWEPARNETPADYRERPWFASWWKVMAIREQLEAMAKQQGIKPSRAAVMRQEWKRQAELAERELVSAAPLAQLSKPRD